ncbi:MAG: hypothetical protein AAFU85_00110 [Planctomycetota bacterium]
MAEINPYEATDIEPNPKPTSDSQPIGWRVVPMLVSSGCGLTMLCVSFIVAASILRDASGRSFEPMEIRAMWTTAAFSTFALAWLSAALLYWRRHYTQAAVLNVVGVAVLVLAAFARNSWQ